MEKFHEPSDSVIHNHQNPLEFTYLALTDAPEQEYSLAYTYWWEQSCFVNIVFERTMSMFLFNILVV
jgi:hypothetical protein